MSKNKLYIIGTKIDSAMPAGEILDALGDILDEQIHASQIISVERMEDEV